MPLVMAIKQTAGSPRALNTLIELSLLLAVAFLPVSKALVEIGATSALLLWLLQKALHKETLLKTPILNGLYLIFLALVSISLVNAPAELLGIGARGILKWVEYVGLFFLSFEIFQDPKSRKRLIAVFLVSMTVTALNGFYQLATGADLLRHKTLDPGRIIRMKSSLGSPNGLAAFFLIALPLAFAMVRKSLGQFWKFAGFLALLALFTSAFIFTFSRAAFFALILALIFQIFLNRKWKWLFIIAGGILGLSLLFKDFAYNYFGSLNLKDVTIGERLELWKLTWQIIQEHPWLGSGVNLFHHKLVATGAYLEHGFKYAHNCYLQMWSEIGLLGLLAFLVPLGFIFRPIRTGQPDSALGIALQTGLIAFLIQAFFDTNFYGLETSVLFWIFWGTFVGLSREGVT